MENIIYRHYREGDEKQLVDLFNIAFQQNGLGPVRTPKNWIWRYPQSPGFEPEMCQIAEDVDRKKIIGAVYANLIEEVPFGSKKYLMGDINDVSCHPDYIRKKIATRLMEMTFDYMKRKGCDFSILSTGIKGNARKYIYKRLGYIDFDKDYIFIQFPNIPHLIKNIYGLSFFFPALFLLSYFPRFLNRIKIMFKNSFNNVSYEINYYKKHAEYMRVANKLIPKHYDGYPGYSKSKFKWARIKVPATQNKPTYIIMKREGDTIGGAVITHQNIYSFKFGIKIKFGIIHEIFIDEDKFDKKRDVHLAYVYLIDKIMKAATHRSLGLLLYISSIKDYTLNKAFKGMNFLRFQSEVVMLKVLKENLKIPQIKKPLFLPTYISIGVP
ncbi:MAG: GNAT family N-acetyltransferase [Candidatus Lokiarchaeota archaeon]|nr:GNAT family N-acetyltransferase [Candidatus Lokiarchaeota archaeon]